MYRCTNCNFSTNEENAFCPRCGNRLVSVSPAYTYQSVHPTYYPAAPVKKPALAKKIVSLALSADAMGATIVAFFYTLSFIALSDGEFAFLMSLVFALISLPPAIIGMVFASSCRNQGDTSVLTKLGKIFGLIGIIMTGVNLFFGFIALATLF